MRLGRPKDKLNYNKIIDDSIIELEKVKTYCYQIGCKHDYLFARQHLTDLKISIKQMENKDDR